MTRRDSARLGAVAVAQKAAARAAELRQLLDEGEAFKLAAHKVGVSVRAARRYRQRWR